MTLFEGIYVIDPSLSSRTRCEEDGDAVARGDLIDGSVTSLFPLMFQPIKGHAVHGRWFGVFSACRYALERKVEA